MDMRVRTDIGIWFKIQLAQLESDPEGARAKSPLFW